MFCSDLSSRWNQCCDLKTRVSNRECTRAELQPKFRSSSRAFQNILETSTACAQCEMTTLQLVADQSPTPPQINVRHSVKVSSGWYKTVIQLLQREQNKFPTSTFQPLICSRWSGLTSSRWGKLPTQPRLGQFTYCWCPKPEVGPDKGRRLATETLMWEICFGGVEVA